jgi:hypothetical protein
MTECPREDDVLDAIHRGAVMAEDLRRHVEHCPLCRDLALVSDALLAPGAAPPAIASPGLLWWKGQIQARREKRQRVERPLVIAEAMGALAPVAGGFYLLGGWPLASAALALAIPAALWYFRRAYHSE